MESPSETVKLCQVSWHNRRISDWMLLEHEFRN